MVLHVMTQTAAHVLTRVKAATVLAPTLLSVELSINATSPALAPHQLDYAATLKRWTALRVLMAMHALALILAKVALVWVAILSFAPPPISVTTRVHVPLQLASVPIQPSPMALLAMTATLALALTLVKLASVMVPTQSYALPLISAILPERVTLRLVSARSLSSLTTLLAMTASSAPSATCATVANVLESQLCVQRQSATLLESATVPLVYVRARLLQDLELFVMIATLARTPSSPPAMALGTVPQLCLHQATAHPRAVVSPFALPLEEPQRLVITAHTLRTAVHATTAMLVRLVMLATMAPVVAHRWFAPHLINVTWRVRVIPRQANAATQMLPTAPLATTVNYARCPTSAKAEFVKVLP